MHTQNLLITGASGFVGGALARAFVEAGWSGLAASRSETRDLPRGWSWRGRDAVLREGAGDRAPEAVIHLEVKQHVLNPTTDDIAEFQRVNVEGTRAWLDWCGQHGVTRFILFSTIKAVEPGGKTDAEYVKLPTDDARLSAGRREDDPERPGETPYGRSKWEAEQLVRSWAAAGPERSALILRPAVVYGPGNTANIYAMVDGLARGRFCLIGQNNNVKSVVSKKNLAAATVHLVNGMRPGCGVFYITDRESVSVRAMAGMVAEMLGKKNPPTIPRPLAGVLARGGDVFTKVTGRNFPLTSNRLEALTETTHFNCGKLLKTGFQHPQSLREGLGEMVEWYRAEHSVHQETE